MSTILITGSNRGLGLAWVREYAEAGWRVIATCRKPLEASDLQDLAKSHKALTVHSLDVTDGAQIEALTTELKGTSIDILINNAGIYAEKNTPPGGAALFDDAEWIRTFRVNTLGPVRVTRALKNHLLTSHRRLVIAISSTLGSIAGINEPGSYFYRSSKAALNAAMRGLAFELAPLGITVVLLHPGWVRTRMGGSEAPLTPQESVRGMRPLIDRLSLPDSGRFLRYDGREIPW